MDTNGPSPIPASAPGPATSLAPRLVVVDDDPDIRALIRAQLTREAYAVREAGSAAALRAALAAEPAELIVLDLGLPDGDGLMLCRELRAEGYEGQIIMVTARDAAIDRVLGLELGADDYLVKPFEPRELLARVRNLLRRRGGTGGAGAGLALEAQGPGHGPGATPPAAGAAQGRPAHARVALFGPWRLDLFQRRLVATDGHLVMLSSAEFRLLSRLIEAPNRVLSREELLPERGATVAFDRSLDIQISRLRQKLAGESGGQELILTVRNEGYVLAATVAYE